MIFFSTSDGILNVSFGASQHSKNQIDESHSLEVRLMKCHNVSLQALFHSHASGWTSSAGGGAVIANGDFDPAPGSAAPKGASAAWNPVEVEIMKNISSNLFRSVVIITSQVRFYSRSHAHTTF